MSALPGGHHAMPDFAALRSPRVRDQGPARIDDELRSVDSLRVESISEFANVRKHLEAWARVIEMVRPQVREADVPLRAGQSDASMFGDTRASSNVQKIAQKTRNVCVQVDASLADLHKCLKDTASVVDRVARSIQAGNRQDAQRLKRLFDTQFAAPRQRPGAQHLAQQLPEGHAP
jgi:hypothetical protein